MLLEYFTNGTKATKTGGMIGAEIETDFVLRDGSPITEEMSWCILHETVRRPESCLQKLELGRQKIELAIAPQPTIWALLEEVYKSLRWLYRCAAQFEARPLFMPVYSWDEPLLWVQEERDEIWVGLDGREALEHLCRCSAVQFTVDVNPADACQLISRLSTAGIGWYGPNSYLGNHEQWRKYIYASHARYLPWRYGGPGEFESIEDYVARLTQHDVVMHKGQPVRLRPEEVPDLNIDLFLRSVWWHHRLRRYGDSLALEMRPFARGADEDIAEVLLKLKDVIGL